MWFGYNPQIIICHCFGKRNLVIFQGELLSKCIDSGYLVRATPFFIRFNFNAISYVEWMIYE